MDVKKIGIMVLVASSVALAGGLALQNGTYEVKSDASGSSWVDISVDGGGTTITDQNGDRWDIVPSGMAGFVYEKMTGSNPGRTCEFVGNAAGVGTYTVKEPNGAVSDTGAFKKK